jgi:hypothetical protein
METHTSIDMGRLGGAEDVKTAPLADVVAAFKTSLTAGLSSASAARRLTALGPNEIVRPSRSRVLRFLSFVWYGDAFLETPAQRPPARAMDARRSPGRARFRLRLCAVTRCRT